VNASDPTYCLPAGREVYASRTIVVRRNVLQSATSRHPAILAPPSVEVFDQAGDGWWSSCSVATLRREYQVDHPVWEWLTDHGVKYNPGDKS
jgi:hypothetical protein